MIREILNLFWVIAISQATFVRLPEVPYRNDGDGDVILYPTPITGSIFEINKPPPKPTGTEGIILYPVPITESNFKIHKPSKEPTVFEGIEVSEIDPGYPESSSHYIHPSYYRNIETPKVAYFNPSQIAANTIFRDVYPEPLHYASNAHFVQEVVVQNVPSTLEVVHNYPSTLQAFPVPQRFEGNSHLEIYNQLNSPQLKLYAQKVRPLTTISIPANPKKVIVPYRRQDGDGEIHIQEYVEICLLENLFGESDYDCDSFYITEQTYIVEPSDFRPINI